MQLIKLKDKFNKYFKLDPASPSGLAWRRPSSKHSSYECGDTAGSLNDRGYYRLSLFGKEYKVHRVIAVLADLPDAELLRKGCCKNVIDHLNRVRGCNHPDNLRVVTPTINNQNRGILA